MKYKYTQEMLNDVYKLIGRYLNRQYEAHTDKPILVFYTKKDYAYPLLVKSNISGNYPIILNNQQIQNYIEQYRIADAKRSLTKWKDQFFKEVKQACVIAERDLLAGKETKDTSNVLKDYEKKNHVELQEAFKVYSKLYRYTKSFSDLDKDTLIKYTKRVRPKYATILTSLISVVTYEDFVRVALKLSNKAPIFELVTSCEVAISII